MILTTQHLDTLKMARYEFLLRACGEALLPPFLGSTLRGSFGHALKAVACSMPHGDCGNCFLVERCLYPKLFETSARKNSGLLGKGDDAPRPFIFSPPQPRSDSGFLRARDDLLRCRVKVEGGQQLVFGLTLLGHACIDLPYVIYAISLMAQHGFGADRSSFALEAVAAIDADGNRELIYTPAMTRIQPYEEFETTLGALVQTRLIELAREDGARRRRDEVLGSAATLGSRDAELPVNMSSEKRVAVEETGVQYKVATAAGIQHLHSPRRSSVSVPSSATSPPSNRQSTIGNELTLRFVTPTRMRIKGELLENPSFPQLVRSLSLRLSMLVQTHTGTPLDYDYRRMIELAESVRTRSSGLRLMALDRLSNSQVTKLRMDGFTGEIAFAGPEIPELMPLVVAGEFLNLGSATAFGLGCYMINP